MQRLSDGKVFSKGYVARGSYERETGRREVTDIIRGQIM